MTVEEREKALLRASAMSLDALAAAHRELVRALSNDLPHHQGCWVGGLSRGLRASISGSPCWCGIKP